MTHPRVYIVTGISGSGKTTVARHLLGLGEIAFDSKINPNLYHFVDKEGDVAQSQHLNDPVWRSRYKWSLNEAVLDDLLQQHHDAPRVFLCGRANIHQYWNKADKVFLLKITEPTLRKRLNEATRDNLFVKDRATQHRLIGDLDMVQESIIKKGAVIINAELPIENVVRQLLALAV